MKSFDDWFYQGEGPHGWVIKAERCYASIGSDPDHNLAIRAWLKAAFDAGVKSSQEDTLETLGDYATACAGIADKYFTFEKAFDMVSDNLEVYYEGLNKEKGN